MESYRGSLRFLIPIVAILLLILFILVPQLVVLFVVAVVVRGAVYRRKHRFDTFVSEMLK